jgi:hypothetical protein
VLGGCAVAAQFGAADTEAKHPVRDIEQRVVDLAA